MHDREEEKKPRGNLPPGFMKHLEITKEKFFERVAVARMASSKSVEGSGSIVSG